MIADFLELQTVISEHLSVTFVRLNRDLRVSGRAYAHISQASVSSVSVIA